MTLPGASFFFRRRTVWVPAWPAWILLAILGAAAGAAFLRGIHPWLAVDAPKSAGDGRALLVLEGWLPDYGTRAALDRFRAGGYSRLVVTGGPIPPGVPCATAPTYAERSALRLLEFGLPTDSLATVPSHAVDKDRTYAEGLALAAWMDSLGIHGMAVDVVSMSTHARRSHRLYSMALGARAEVGVHSVRDMLYDPAEWWRSSPGVKSVLMECISLAYTVLLFHPRG